MFQSLHLSAIWALSGTSMSLLYWGSQSWTQQSKCGLRSAEERGRITSLPLLPILCLRQPRMPLASLCHRCSWLAPVHLGAHQDQHRSVICSPPDLSHLSQPPCSLKDYPESSLSHISQPHQHFWVHICVNTL